MKALSHLGEADTLRTVNRQISKHGRVTCLLMLAVSLTTHLSHAQTEFRFERMWPTLQQPWYFAGLASGAVDGLGNVYVTVGNFPLLGNNQIEKFDSNGNFLLRWGSTGSGDGQFDFGGFYPGIALDSSDNVYVSDTLNSRIQKFDSNGTFLAKWGSSGTEDGEFGFPSGIAVNASGDVYVLDIAIHRIQKFLSDGTFVTKWGGDGPGLNGSGSGEGEFNSPVGVAVDTMGNVYVADSHNSRIQKFDSDGTFLTQWGSLGTGNGEFDTPLGVAVDTMGNVYVADSLNSRIQKFDSDGIFLTQWGSSGTEDGQWFFGIGVVVDALDNVYLLDLELHTIQKFASDGTFLSRWGSSASGAGQFIKPFGIGVDASGNTYVADGNNHRIQKFAPSGIFLDQWGTAGTGNGEFFLPVDVAVDTSGNVYVADGGNNRIQKFDSSGMFVTKWGSEGSGDGQFILPFGVTVDSSDNVYVADIFNDRIQKFDSDGNFLLKWGSLGTGDGQFDGPSDVAVDSLDNVYVADTSNDRIQKFDSNGTFLLEWGSFGSGDGEFISPFGVAVDSLDNVYVAEIGNNRIQKFASNGNFLAKWGSSGTAPGQFNRPFDVAADPSGNVYVVDNENNRIQKFVPITVPSNAKAIVVAAGGPFPGNTLWDATQYSANFAYRSLTFQGFTKDRIQYLSSDTDLDLDGNGLPDDVDGDATNANLQAALETWASDADNLVVYLVDHGGADKFRMSGTENLLASELAQWVQTADNNISGTITFVYDACQSGSFLSALGGPGRIVVTSAAGSENAYFLSQGTISFSNFFWEQVFNGFSVLEAFELAEAAMLAYQTPQLDDNGNGVANEPGDGMLAATTFIGNGTDFNLTRPTIDGPVGVVEGTVIPSGSTATIFADNVTDAEGSIARVWAVLRPPNFVPPSADNPISGFPTVDLLPVGGDRFEGVFDGFTEAGTYQIVIYALDANTETSLPLITSLSVDNPLKHKAIIAIGADPADPEWPVIQEAARLAYETLLFQQYTDAEIQFYSPVTFSAGVDGTLTQSNLNFAINTWAPDQGFDLVVYMVGTGGDTGTFRLNETETLAASTLDGWLDTLQASLPGRVTVLYDGSKSGSFAPALTPPVDKERIFIGSTNASQAVNFLLDGEVSFSRFFWRQVLNGADVGDAFAHATLAMSFAAGGQTGTLDDNANGLVNEKSDGALARRHRIGTGIILAGDDPLIGSNAGDVVIGASTFATFGVNDVTTTGTLSRVWAVISPPFFSDARPHLLASVDLVSIGNDDYEGSFGAFTELGDYTIAVFAQDDEGVISLPQGIAVTQPSSAFTEADSAIELRDNFETLDTNDSGGLTLAEAQAQIPGLTTTVFNQLDDDSNGVLTLAELIDGSVGVPGIHDPVYVDFSYSLFECGSDLQPFNTLGEGVAFVQPGGTLYLRGGNSPEAVTISTAMTLAVQSAAVTIGAP